MEFNEELINKFGNDLLIGLTNEENKDILEEFKAIEASMNLINEIDGISNIEPMHYPFIVTPTLRDDKIIENEEVNDLLKNSDKINDREIEVLKVVE